jgi:hypothetical protein
MGRCQAENQSSTTQKATNRPTPPIAIQPNESNSVSGSGSSASAERRTSF